MQDNLNLKVSELNKTKVIGIIVLNMMILSCSSSKPISNNIDNDPNVQYYGEYKFDVEIPSVVFPFEASLTIGTSKRGNITSRIIWSFQGQSFYNSVVRNLRISRIFASIFLQVDLDKYNVLDNERKNHEPQMKSRNP